jgi:hypothetical protein
MARVNIPDADSLSWDDFRNRNSIQVRVTVSPDEEGQYQKGSVVDVAHMKEEAQGRIVSEPLSIEDHAGEKKKVLSLIIEKTEK